MLPLLNIVISKLLKKYPVNDKELIATKYAFVRFRVHLRGFEPFVVDTNHASFRTVTQSLYLFERMARWLPFFCGIFLM